MDVTRIDGYLLAGRPPKADVIAHLAAVDVEGPAAPFVRALRAVGVRAADETLVALRLVAAGRSPDDAAVRRLRALAALVRDPGSRDAVVARDGEAIPEFAGVPAAETVAAARTAYEKELQMRKNGTPLDGEAL